MGQIFFLTKTGTLCHFRNGQAIDLTQVTDSGGNFSDFEVDARHFLFHIDRTS